MKDHAEYVRIKQILCDAGLLESNILKCNNCEATFLCSKEVRFCPACGTEILRILSLN
jgi:NADH pyrophosphatase NudC (nudix superfamily)